MSWLSFEDVHVRYGEVEGLSGVSFEVDRGQMVGIIGRNGAGKTTTLKAIAGIHRPSQGRIMFDKKRCDNRPSHEIVKMGIAYVPEGRRIFGALTVLENLKLGAYIHYRKRRKEVVKANLENLFRQFSTLKEKRHQLAGTLSGGEQQLLAIARALMSVPTFLLLDEPSMGLAPKMVSQVFEVIHKLHSEGLTVLIVEQKAFLTLRMVDQAYVLANGKIKLFGTGKELLKNKEVKHTYLGRK
ncbi:MAG: ABC transporter ATP-binding protein [Desulfobacteraceae bacterium]|nr:MAG: ABC transporter ATP-binding protein [Desulfobacteraceae bacterium]